MSDLLQLHAVAIFAPIAGAMAVIAWRVRETQSPVTTRKIVIPPLAMSTGFSMFLAPAFRVPWTMALGAFLLGALVLSYPLARTSTLTRVGDAIMLRRSRHFLVILLGLVAVRLALRPVVGDLVSVRQTGGVFFVLAFGMIVRWRAGMLLRYRALRAAMDAGAAPSSLGGALGLSFGACAPPSPSSPAPTPSA
jgi:membrane protein CcdC involved in cytochrome C biogenesis